MQEKCKKIIEELFQLKVRENKNEFRFNIKELNTDTFGFFSYVEGMYKEIYIKRSGLGLVIIFKF